VTGLIHHVGFDMLLIPGHKLAMAVKQHGPGALCALIQSQQ
jgi:hypothetical protein